MKKFTTKQLNTSYRMSSNYDHEGDIDIDYFISECRLGLNAIGIEVDYHSFNDSTIPNNLIGLSVGDDFDLDECQRTISGYLDLIDNDYDYGSPESIDNLKKEGYTDTEIKLINNYNNETIGRRGADDGTYDYCGSFIVEILEWIERIMKPRQSHCRYIIHVVTSKPHNNMTDNLIKLIEQPGDNLNVITDVQIEGDYKLTVDKEIENYDGVNVDIYRELHNCLLEMKSVITFSVNIKMLFPKSK